MDQFGDGSDGSLHVTGTTNLLLDHLYQYTDITIDAGATLTTADTIGSVLYLLCTGTVIINGTIALNNKIAAGQNGYVATINGGTYNNPSTANGAAGSGTYGGPQWKGFGGGGAGGSTYMGGTPIQGGHGGTGSPAVGFAGAGHSHTWSYGDNTYITGGDAGVSTGGGGALAAFVVSSDDPNPWGTSGDGGGTHGANGANGTGGNLGENTYLTAAGGGGGGGFAGKPGIHLVIKSPSINLGVTSIINTSGTSGSDAGNGGSAYNWRTTTATNGYGGGGGGGGNAGSVYLSSWTLSNAGTITKIGGGGGWGGGYGGSGSAGNLNITTLFPTGPFPTFFRI